MQLHELALAEHLRHASPSGRQVALDARRSFDRDGIDVAELRPCDPEARDDTRLPNCVKTYLPVPAGRWRMILDVVRSPELSGISPRYATRIAMVEVIDEPAGESGHGG